LHFILAAAVYNVTMILMKIDNDIVSKCSADV